MSIVHDSTHRSAALRRLLALLAVLGLVAAACGSSASDAGGDDDATTTVDDGTEDAGEGGADSDDPSGADDPEASDDDSDAGAPTGSSQTRLGSVIDSAVDPATAQNSARFAGTMEFVSNDPALGGDFALTFTGAYDLAQDSMEIELDFAGMLAAMADGGGLSGMEAMFEDPMVMRSIGEDGWLKWGFFSIAGVQPDQWVLMNSSEVGDLTSGFGVAGATTQSPMGMLEHLREADADITELGTETIDGVQTTHYEALVDIDAASANLDPEAKAQLAEAFADGAGPLAMQFWIGDDGLLYRWSMTLDGSSIEGADGVESMTVAYEFSDYGADVNITAPDPATVVDGNSLGF